MGSEAEPPVRFRDRAPGQGVLGQSPLNVKSCLFACPMEVANLLYFLSANLVEWSFVEFYSQKRHIPVSSHTLEDFGGNQ